MSSYRNIWFIWFPTWFFLILGCASSQKVSQTERASEEQTLEVQTRAESHFVAAKIFELQRNYHAAIVELMDAVAIDSTSSTLYYRLAENYTRLGDSYVGEADQRAAWDKYQRAIEFAKKAVRIERDFVRGYKLLVQLFKKTRDIQSEAKALEALIRFSPSEIEKYPRLINIYLHQRERDRAVILLDRFLNLEGVPRDAQLWVAATYTRLDRIDKAKESYQIILSQHPSSAEAWIGLASILDSRGDQLGAVGLHRRALAAVSDSAKIFSSLAATIQDSELMLDQLLKEERENPRFCYYLGRALLAGGKPQQAKKALEVAAKTIPRDGDVLYSLGYALKEEGKWDEAISVFHRTVALDPEDTDYLFQLGATLEEASREIPAPEFFDEAVKTFRRLLEIDAEHAWTLNYLGYMFAEKGVNLQEAVEILKKAVSKEPENGAFLDSLGWAYYRLGQFEKAEEYLDRAVQYETENEIILDHIGDVAWELGKKDKAKMHWMKSLKLDPNNEEVRDKLDRLKSEKP